MHSPIPRISNCPVYSETCLIRSFLLASSLALKAACKTKTEAAYGRTFYGLGLCKCQCRRAGAEGLSG